MRSSRLNRLVAIVLLLTTLLAVVPAHATAQNGAKPTAASDCKHGGWQSLRDGSGDPFPNQGQCVSFAVQGGAFYQEPVVTAPTPVLTIVGGVSTYEGFVAGTGFTPGATVTSVVWESEPFGLGDTYRRPVRDVASFVPDPIEGDGSFTSMATVSWCNDVWEGWIQWDLTLWTLTVVDSTGFSHSQVFNMQPYCGLS